MHRPLGQQAENNQIGGGQPRFIAACGGYGGSLGFLVDSFGLRGYYTSVV